MINKMKLFSNKKVLCLIIIIVILFLLAYTFYNNTNTNSNALKYENFSSVDADAYSPKELGEPLSNQLNSDIILNAQSNIYNLERKYQIINIISNISGTKLIALCSDSSNNNLTICILNNNSNKWNCLAFDSLNNAIESYNKINPSITLPEMNNNISCTKDSTVILTHNSKTLFLINESYNLMKRINCLYYSVNQSLNCISLPILNNPSTTQNNNERPPLNYDKMNFITANDTLLIGLGCTNKLYYLILDNNTNAPSRNSIWNTLELNFPNIPNADLKNIYFLGLNNFAIYIYYNDFKNPATLLYAPLTMVNGRLSLTLVLFPINKNSSNTQIPPNFYSRNFAVNNNVIFGLEKADRSGNMILWWCPLNNGLPINNYKWNNMNLANQGIPNIPFYNLTGLNIFNNNLIINYNTGNKYNFVIPLLSNTTTPATNTTRMNTNTTTTLATTSQPATTMLNSNITTTSTTTTTPTTTPTTTTMNSNTTVVNANLETLPNVTTTSANINNSITSESPTTTLMNNSIEGETQKSGNNELLRTDIGINDNINDFMKDANLFNDNNNNINDFMKDANLFGNNIYVSPINNDQLYNPQSNLSQPNKITSSFFPMIRIV